MDIEKEQVFKNHILNNGINLFIGAGFSYEAFNMFRERLPLGNALKEKLVKEFGLQQYDSFSLSQISNIIKNTQRGDFYRFLQDLYKVYDFDESYNYLDEIKIKNIFSINIDNLVERIFEHGSKNNILYDVSICGKIDNDGIDFHKLHGSITYPIEHELLFTPEELSILFTKEPARFHGVALKIASRATIFWGTKMEDANVLSLLSQKTIKGFEPKEKWIVITPENCKDIDAKYFKTLNFNIIRAYTKDLLRYFKKISEESTSGTYKEEPATRKLNGILKLYFSSNYIEQILATKHPVRPIKSFFTGDDPVWNDIIENKIIKLSIYNDCVSSIHKNNMVLITGGVGSGKSTLLMQLSVDKDITGLKFFFSGLTIPKAMKLNNILNEYKGEKIIFLDNISNNLDAFLYLINTGNFKLVCADRDLNYEMIKHKTRFKKEEIIDITELTDMDVQAICNLAHNTTFKKQNRTMSLFEIAYYVWKGKKLSSKIDDLISDLSNNPANSQLLEFFGLMTYVRNCGISASMDMLILYYSDDEVEYHDIYKYTDTLSSMIDDEEHFTISKEQDFFTLRSKLFAELTIDRLPSNVLAKVLKKFANNVHRDCIVRYDIFKRKGFDADIAILAFDNVEDGKEYFENIIAMDKSEYRYQQYALYLFRKQHYREAWNQIEIAHSIKPNNLAIKNTHAYILFRNNIGIKEDIETVKETVEYTFNVISSCISKDLRKTFHVITFAENAISYFNRFQNTSFRNESTKYIDIANEYINEEFSRNDFIPKRNYRRLKNLRKQLEYIKTITTV